MDWRNDPYLLAVVFKKVRSQVQLAVAFKPNISLVERKSIPDTEESSMAKLIPMDLSRGAAENVWRVKPKSATKGMSIEFQTLQFTMQSSSSHPVFVKSFHVNMSSTPPKWHLGRNLISSSSPLIFLVKSCGVLMTLFSLSCSTWMSGLGFPWTSHRWQVHGQQTVSKAKDMLQINAKAHEEAERTIATSQPWSSEHVHRWLCQVTKLMHN